MMHRKIVGANANPGAPDGIPERECGRLPVRVVPDPVWGNRCESAWSPTPEELVLLNAGGVVVLTVCGWQVPVSLTVAPATEVEPDAPQMTTYGDKVVLLNPGSPRAG